MTDLARLDALPVAWIGKSAIEPLRNGAPVTTTLTPWLALKDDTPLYTASPLREKEPSKRAQMFKEAMESYRDAAMVEAEEAMRLRDKLAAAESERDQAKRNELAIRELMNCYNLGGWTDAEAAMKRALAAESRLAELAAKHDADLTLILSEHDKDVRDSEARIAGLEGMREDAERYRWLRADDGTSRNYGVAALICFADDDWIVNDTLDRLIDAARAAREHGNG